MQRSAVLRTPRFPPPMHVSFRSSAYEGVRLRIPRDRSEGSSRFRLIRSVPLQKSVEVPVEIVSVSEPLVIASDREQDLRIVIDDEAVSALTAMEPPAMVVNNTLPSRERREVSWFVATYGLRADYDAVGQYIRFMLGHHGSQRGFIQHRVEASLRRHPSLVDHFTAVELFQREVSDLAEELTGHIRRHGRWLPDETRQGYRACRLRYRNHEFFILIDHDGNAEEPGRIVAICTSARFRQSMCGRTSLHRQKDQRQRPRTVRHHWRSCND